MSLTSKVTNDVKYNRTIYIHNDVEYKAGMCGKGHERSFSYSSLADSETTWLRPEEQKFDGKNKQKNYEINTNSFIDGTRDRGAARV